MSTPLTFFVDSADRAQAVRWLSSGIATGLTTNPTILKRGGATFSYIPTIYRWATDAGAREVCFQTWGASAEEWYANDMRLRELAPNAVIKVPGNERGAGVITRLQAQGIDILMTAGYSHRQAIVGSALGVKYFAPYFHRMKVTGRDSLGEFAAMAQAIPQDGSDTLVMAASLKSGQDIADLIHVGIRTFTVAPDVLEDFLHDDVVEQAIDAFEEDMRDVLA